jgi:hypothetical protein
MSRLPLFIDPFSALEGRTIEYPVHISGGLGQFMQQVQMAQAFGIPHQAFNPQQTIHIRHEVIPKRVTSVGCIILTESHSTNGYDIIMIENRMSMRHEVFGGDIGGNYNAKDCLNNLTSYLSIQVNDNTQFFDIQHPNNGKVYRIYVVFQSNFSCMRSDSVINSVPILRNTFTNFVRIPITGILNNSVSHSKLSGFWRDVAIRVANDNRRMY